MKPKRNTAREVDIDVRFVCLNFRFIKRQNRAPAIWVPRLGLVDQVHPEFEYATKRALAIGLVLDQYLVDQGFVFGFEELHNQIIVKGKRARKPLIGCGNPFG